MHRPDPRARLWTWLWTRLCGGWARLRSAVERELRAAQREAEANTAAAVAIGDEGFVELCRRRERVVLAEVPRPPPRASPARTAVCTPAAVAHRPRPPGTVAGRPLE